MKVVVDRIEGELAVLEVDGGFVDWPLRSLPASTVEGTVLEVSFRVSSPNALPAEPDRPSESKRVIDL